MDTLQSRPLLLLVSLLLDAKYCHGLGRLTIPRILMTLRGDAIIQANSDVVDIISRAILPGLSIKGLISIGPEFDLTGSMDASLKVSGVLNAGVSVAWAKAEVYFPQDSDGIAASIAPGTLDDSNDPYKQTYSIEPTFDASVTATGNLALTLTPQVKFRISVLGDVLMSGYVTAGVVNTITLGFSPAGQRPPVSLHLRLRMF